MFGTAPSHNVYTESLGTLRIPIFIAPQPASNLIQFCCGGFSWLAFFNSANALATSTFSCEDCKLSAKSLMLNINGRPCTSVAIVYDCKNVSPPRQDTSVLMSMQPGVFYYSIFLQRTIQPKLRLVLMYNSMSSKAQKLL